MTDFKKFKQPTDMDNYVQTQAHSESLQMNI